VAYLKALSFIRLERLKKFMNITLLKEEILKIFKDKVLKKIFQQRGM